MREVCTYEAPLGTTLTDGPVEIGFGTIHIRERLGWREIVARGSGVTLRHVEGDLRDSVSERLRRYPEDRISSPLADAALVVAATAGGPSLSSLDVPDAAPRRPSVGSTDVRALLPSSGTSPVQCPRAGDRAGRRPDPSPPDIFRSPT